MSMIDADTHVDECESTWAKLQGTQYAKYIPVTISMPPDEAGTWRRVFATIGDMDVAD